MKSLLQPEVVLALFAFLATLIGIRGNTWDAAKKGWRRLTGMGWLTVAVALGVVGIQTAVAIKAAREEKRREAAKESVRQLALREMARLAEELRQRFIFIPESIHQAHVEQTHAPQSASISVITMGEKFSYGHWGLTRSPFALETFRRPVRLTAIKRSGLSLPDELGQFMSQWAGSLDRAFLRDRNDFTDDEMLVCAVSLSTHFLRSWPNA